MQKRPNILLLVADQHRADWVSGNPHIPVRTPCLERLMARGRKYTNALCASPAGGPSRACLATGRPYPAGGVSDNGSDLDVNSPNFYRGLSQAGYHVIGCGKMDLRKANPPWSPDGRNGLIEYGFNDGLYCEGKNDSVDAGCRGPYRYFLKSENWLEDHEMDAVMRAGRPDVTYPSPLPDHAYLDNWIGYGGMECLGRAPTDRPWFMQVSFAGPHAPWDATEGMQKLYRGIPFPEPLVSSMPGPVHQAVRQNYSAMIENIDRWVGLYVEAIDTRGERENTMVIYTSDHGAMLGDHDQWGSAVPGQASVAVPLVMSGPDIDATTIHSAVSTRDLAATILEHCGAPLKDDAYGTPLSGAESTDAVAVSAYGDWKLAFDGRYKLVRTGDTESAYDLRQDPAETTPADIPDAILARLQSALAAE